MELDLWYDLTTDLIESQQYNNNTNRWSISTKLGSTYKESIHV